MVAEAADGEEGVTAVPDAGPTSCSWTSGCPGGTGWRRPVDPPERVPCRVIVLTTFDLDAYVYAALRAGASGLLLKDPSPERLATAVRMIVAGDAILAPGITRRLVERFARQVVAAAPGRSGLAHGARARGTPAGGARAEQRRDRRQAPPGRGHRQDPRDPYPVSKLWLRDRVQAVAAAYESGLVRPEDPGMKGPRAIARPLPGWIPPPDPAALEVWTGCRKWGKYDPDGPPLRCWNPPVGPAQQPLRVHPSGSRYTLSDPGLVAQSPKSRSPAGDAR